MNTTLLSRQRYKETSFYNVFYIITAEMPWQDPCTKALEKCQSKDKYQVPLSTAKTRSTATAKPTLQAISNVDNKTLVCGYQVWIGLLSTHTRKACIELCAKLCLNYTQTC